MTPENNVNRTEEPRLPPPPGSKDVRRRRPWTFVFLLVALCGLLWGGFAFYSILFGSGKSVEGALTYEVARSPLQVTIAADGNVESASNIEVKCRVAGGSTILWIVEDGKIVQEGEEIVRLDTSAIEDKLNSQRIVYEKALATQIQAQEDLEATKISVKEYEEGTFVEQLQLVEASIRIALENLRSAENQLTYSEKMVRKGFVSSLQREADQFGVERAKLDLDAANTRKKVLVEFTKIKTLRDLEAKREAAAARLRSEQASLQLEKARLDRLEEQLKNCSVTAPAKGMVVYANDSDGHHGTQQPKVEEGAMVRESQTLVRLPDLTQMQVKVTIHESRVDQVRPGLPARVVIQDQEHTGKVLSVANQPAPTSWFSANIKEYPTIVSIEGETTGLRPGMTARVTILVDDVSDALCVPVSAVVEQRNQFFCWVSTPEGPSRRLLQLGRTNDKLIEVADGVKEHDVVFRNPRAVVEEARQEPAFEKQAEDLRFEPGAGAESPAAGAAAPPARQPVTSEQATGGAGPAGAEPGGEGARGEPGKRGGRGSFDPMQLDKDGDKKLSREELPEQMQGMFDRLDTNGDGAIDSAELSAMRRRRGTGPPGGAGVPGVEGTGPAREGPGGSRDGSREGRGSGGAPPGESG
jgi:HlyD family secretion protein